jgi:SSS family solute:Na+ symporter
LILVTGAVVVVYATLGGIVAVMWADAIQAVVLTLGAVISLGVIWYHLPAGPLTVWQIAAEQTPHKFAWGDWGWPPISGTAFWLILCFGIFENLKNFGVDQNYIQRYVSARPAEAIRSVWLGALLYLPVSGLFLLIGTSLFAFYHQHPTARAQVEGIVRAQRPTAGGVDVQQRPDGGRVLAGGAAASAEPQKIGDRVFPHFIANYLPPGLLGLLVAAIFSAAMSTVSTSLNSSATIVLSDFYLRGWSPQADDRTRLWVLRATTILLGGLATAGAWCLVALTASALDAWWTISSILGAGILGLFLLGRMVPAARSWDAGWGLAAGMGVVAWIVFGQAFIDKKAAIVFGSVTVVAVGWLSTAGASRRAMLDRRGGGN